MVINSDSLALIVINSFSHALEGPERIISGPQNCVEILSNAKSFPISEEPFSLRLIFKLFWKLFPRKLKLKLCHWPSLRMGPVENGALITFISSSDSPIEDNTSSISGSATSSGFAGLLGA